MDRSAARVAAIEIFILSNNFQIFDMTLCKFIFNTDKIIGLNRRLVEISSLKSYFSIVTYVL